ncbi:MAG: hypothetical protein ABIP06_06105 [Pyrinomonadaceae bacterium]
MKVTLNLTNPLFDNQKRKTILHLVVSRSAIELEKEIKKVILESVPRGTLYGRGAITKIATKKNLGLGLRLVKNSRVRVIAGSRFHRASAKGQPFANDTGQTINSIRARDVSELKAQVSVGVKHAAILDSKNGLDRPFFASTAEKFKPRFKANIEKAIKEIS